MKRIRSSAAIFSMLVMCTAAAHAQTSNGKIEKRTQKLDAATQKLDTALDGLKNTLSNGSSEAAASAGDGMFATLAGFGRAVGEDASVVRTDPAAKFARTAVLVKAADTAHSCGSVCVEFGPLKACIRWETRCY